MTAGRVRKLRGTYARNACGSHTRFCSRSRLPADWFYIAVSRHSADARLWRTPWGWYRTLAQIGEPCHAHCDRRPAYGDLRPNCGCDGWLVGTAMALAGGWIISMFLDQVQYCSETGKPLSLTASNGTRGWGNQMRRTFSLSETLWTRPWWPLWTSSRMEDRAASEIKLCAADESCRLRACPGPSNRWNMSNWRQSDRSRRRPDPGRAESCHGGSYHYHSPWAGGKGQALGSARDLRRTPRRVELLRGRRHMPAVIGE